MGRKMLAAPPKGEGEEEGEEERFIPPACIERFWVEGEEERVLMVCGEVEGEVEELWPKEPEEDPHAAPPNLLRPVGVLLWSSSSSSSSKAGMSIRGVEDDAAVMAAEGEVEGEVEVRLSSSESTSRNSCWNEASFHSRAASASEFALDGSDEEGKAEKSSPNGSSEIESVMVEPVDWKVPQASS